MISACPKCNAAILSNGGECEFCDPEPSPSLPSSPRSQRIAELEKELKQLRAVDRTKRPLVPGLGGAIQKLRESDNLTLTALASRSGLSKGLICSIEKGARPNPCWNTLKALAKGLGIYPGVLVRVIVDAENGALSSEGKEL